MTAALTQGAAVVGDIEVAYASTAGTGLPVVFVHGLAEDHDSWSDRQTEVDGRPTYAYDLRGHGGTTIGDADGTLAQLGRDLLAFLASVSGAAEVVGFSLGGTIALWAAAHDDGGLIPHVVVLGTSSVVGRHAVQFYGQRIDMAADTDSESFVQALTDDTAAGLAVERDRAADVARVRLRAVGDGRGYVNAARAMMRLHDDPLTDDLARIAVPVDVVGATEDSFCPRKAAQVIVDHLAHPTYHEIPHAGHLMNVDNPGGVAAVLTTTLRRSY